MRRKTLKEEKAGESEKAAPRLKPSPAPKLWQGKSQGRRGKKGAAKGRQESKSEKGRKGGAKALSHNKFGRELRAAKRGAEALSQHKFESKQRSG